MINESLSKGAASISLTASEVMLLAFGTLLVLGLIGEYAKSDRWKRHHKKFELMVIIGVAGELLADGGIFLFSHRLQTISDKELASAAERSTAAIKESTNLRFRFADRFIDTAQQASIIKSLSRFQGQQFNYVTYWDAREPLATATQISEILVRAGWALNQRSVRPDIVGNATGIQIFVDNAADASAKQAAAELAKALREAGLVAATKPTESSLQPIGRIQIEIALKE